MEDRYLFRAKRIDNGEWLSGYLYCTYHRHTYISGKYADVIEVDSDTICQCTGLKDKNDNLIWENDIVRHYNNPSHPNEYDIGLILFQDDSPGFERTSRMHDDNVGICSDCIYEVIGNRFDNSEMLEW